MKRLLLTLLTAAALIFTSCQFLEPGYWQQMAEKNSKSGVKVNSMPDCMDEYVWVEISLDDANNLWAGSSYTSNIKNPPAKVNIYQKENSTILKYKDVPLDNFPNWIYNKSIAENIYVYAFNSMLYGEDSVRLNYYIPENLPENSKIYKASENDEYVKFVIPVEEDEESEDGKEPEKYTFIVRKGLLIQQKQYTNIFIEY